MITTLYKDLAFSLVWNKHTSLSVKLIWQKHQFFMIYDDFSHLLCFSSNTFVNYLVRVNNSTLLSVIDSFIDGQAILSAAKLTEPMLLGSW